MVSQFFLTLPPYKKGFHLITEAVLKGLPQLPDKGLLQIFIQHTSAAIAINENASSDVRHDLNLSFNHLAPENEPYYKHTEEGPDDMPAHIKAVVVGSSLTIPITEGRLNLGVWQGIYLCEFRQDPGPRNLVLTVIS